jgi:hypothetical protein
MNLDTAFARQHNGDHRQRKWLGVPTTEWHGNLEQVAIKIPTFARESFKASTNGDRTSENPLYDVIIREPYANSPSRVPVGIVSKTYVLLQHTRVFELTSDAIKAAGVSLDEMRVQALMTAHGERLELQFLFPKEYSIDPGDRNEIRLRLLCVNSVEGSQKFELNLGWFRFICSNGLIIGKTKSSLKELHTDRLNVTRIAGLLKRDLCDVTKHQTLLKRWLAVHVTQETLREWVDGRLRKDWGVKAATRAYHIALHGADARLIPPFEKVNPSQRKVRIGDKVPGAGFSNLNAFGVSQALSWLAKERAEVQEQFQREQEIETLVEQLVSLAS